MTTFQAIVLGVLQGVSELFPISSLGHTVLLPHLFGWDNIVRWQSQSESPWLAFNVMLHVGSALHDHVETVERIGAHAGIICRPVLRRLHVNGWDDHGNRVVEAVESLIFRWGIRIVEFARAVADGKDVLLAGGVSIAREGLAAGLVDEVVLHVVPKLVGRGVRLFDAVQVDMRCVETIEGEGAVHLRYEVQ